MQRSKQVGILILAVFALLCILYLLKKDTSDQPPKTVEIAKQKTDSLVPKEIEEPKEVDVLSEEEAAKPDSKETNEVESVKIKPRSAGYFQEPLEGKLLLSGSFGELRGNHFHAGLDLRTGGSEGKNVLASASGYISRIKISTTGYGKALYIQHPNGTTTVYGHLQKFVGDIQEAVINRQYSLKTYEMDWYVPAGKLKVTKGQIIALSGNTGGSGGPHLHFEIRDKRGNTVNPLIYGIKAADVIKPKILGCRLYNIDQNRYVNYGIYGSIQTKRNGTIKLPPGKYGVGVKWVDYFTDQYNKLGINYAEVQVDGKSIFTQTIEDFAFSQGRFINKHIDYWLYSETGSRYVKMFKESGNGLHFYKGNGIITIGGGKVRNKEVTIVVRDFSGHENKYSFTLVSDITSELPAGGGELVPEGKTYKTNTPIRLASPNATVTIPKGALYNDAVFAISETNPTGKAVSPMVRVLHNNVPLHKSATIRIKIPSDVSKNKSKLVMMRYDKKSRTSSYEGGSVNGNYISETTKSLGMFYLALDTMPPVITPLTVGNYISFRVDDLTSKIKSYACYVDGQWVLLEYEPKAKKLFGNLPKSIKSGNHSLELRVVDGAGNTALLTKTF